MGMPMGLWAHIGPGKGGNKPTNDKGLAAGCLNPENSAALELNNVRTIIYAGGDMWWDRNSRTARYEIPKGSGKHSLYLGSLWVGGISDDNTLKVAAQRYSENGPDFYTGPLSTNGDASIEAETCKEFDKIWKITRAEVARHRLCTQKPDLPDCEGYLANIPQSILDWPAISFADNDPASSGNLPSVQYHYAPFIDVDDNGDYNPEGGDYPAYDLDGKADCQNNRTPFLYGDETLFWIFNDKGNYHYETQSNPIGLEVRAQAFAFATNDEINNMTFYNYEIINRGTTTLKECYFGVNTDADLGYEKDDFVGCDVMRGFGYVYNGDENDAVGNAPTATQYGTHPPAVGIDFFEGPYADPNNKDDVFDINDTETWYALNGVGYGDGIKDNERIGMRRFIYYRSDGSALSDPEAGIEYYNLLRGLWKNGAFMVFGGTGYPGNTSPTMLRADFMYPGDSDPYDWGTKGVDPQFEWTQKNPCPGCDEGQPGDYRFVQSAGPFLLKPGAVNDITTGAVWARAYQGLAFESVELVRKADDKAQQLFDNCFKILNGPDAPDVTVQELDRELILYWTNSELSNNRMNTYAEEDYSIPESQVPDKEDREYKFQGYLVYQVINGSITAEERHDLNKARLIAQCDLRDFDAQGNAIGTLVNYTVDQDLGINMPQVEVQGSNEGIFQSLRVTEDAFAAGADKRLVNHKTYHFLVLAYAYNSFKKYDPNDVNGLDGQKKPFLAGRKSAMGAIQASSGIPHITAPETYGTVINSFYGDMPEITRIEGNGNGGNLADLSPETEAALLQPPYYAEQATYRRGAGPVKIKVVDPLALEKGTYYLALTGPIQSTGPFKMLRVTSRWALLNAEMDTLALSDNDLSINTEQLLFDKKTQAFIGISVVVQQSKQPGNDREVNNGFLATGMEMENMADVYMGFVPDNDIIPTLNWILSGNQNSGEPGILPDNSMDRSESYEKASIGNGGSLAPFILTSYGPDAPGWDYNIPTSAYKPDMLQSIDLVLTADKSKWSRVPVLETAGDAVKAYKHPDLLDDQGILPRKLDLRRSPSVDKSGNFATDNGTQTGNLLSGASGDPEAANYISEWGMGWFPGYAISIETGERLNLAFGEDSYLAFANGRDMLFNPTGVSPNASPDLGQVLSELGDAVLGGKHFIYVFGSNVAYASKYLATPRYDAGASAMELFKQSEAVLQGPGTLAQRLERSDSLKALVMRSAMWTGIPVALTGRSWLSGELRVRMRVSKPYMQYGTYAHDQVAEPKNDNQPLYRFSLDGMAPATQQPGAALSALDLINVVPNPYYAYNVYEKDQLDNRVRITNLPPECTVSIYNVSGTLIRRFNKGTNNITSLDWDLTNYAHVPIASGIYIIHIKVPGVGERVIKWFGVLRPTDLSDF